MITAGKKLASLAAAAVGISLVTVAVGALEERPVTGAVTLPSVNTTVVNTAANPVPTSAVGTTQIAGAVSVSGTPTVNIGSGTVSVASSPTSPLNVQEVAPRDPIGGIPIKRFLTFRGHGSIYVVPDGKVLILEQVHGIVFSPDVVPVAVAGIGQAGAGQDFSLFSVTTPMANGQAYFNQQVRAYFYPGLVEVDIVEQTDGILGSIWLTGRLVDAPQ